MMKSEGITKISVALVEAQSEMPAVQMNKTNPFLKNRYADLGAIIETAQPILKKHGLAISQHCTTRGELVGVETILIHKSGEWLSSKMELPMGIEKGKSQSQIAGSIITYIRRYSLAAMLGMYADEDADGNSPTKPQIERPETPQKTAKKESYTIIPPEVIKDAKTPFDAMDLIESYATVTRGVGGNVLEVIKVHAPDYDDINDIDEEIVITIVEKLTGFRFDKVAN